MDLEAVLEIGQQNKPTFPGKLLKLDWLTWLEISRKLLIFVAAFQAERFGLLAIAILGVVVSIYYYFGVIKERIYVENLKEVKKVKKHKGIKN